MAETLDVLAVGAHPDDAELGCGGTLAAMAGRGYSVAILDLSRGELGSRGTAEQRVVEAGEAAAVLGVQRLENLGMPDGSLSADAASRHQLIEVVRQCRPRLVITHAAWGHPDHHRVYRLVTDACHHAGLARIETGQQPHRPEKLAYWLEYTQPDVPQVVVDISGQWAAKERALRAYRSQLHDPESEGPETYLSRPDFLDQIYSFNRQLGNLAGCDVGEGYLLSRTTRPADLIEC